MVATTSRTVVALTPRCRVVPVSSSAAAAVENLPLPIHGQRERCASLIGSERFSTKAGVPVDVHADEPVAPAIACGDRCRRAGVASGKHVVVPATRAPRCTVAPGVRRSGVSAVTYVSRMGTRRTWVIVASRDHARRGVSNGFVMANHGKRAPVSRMSRGDGIVIYSPTTTYPDGVALRAITIVGQVTGDAPEPSDVIAGGYRRAASLREIEPLPLAELRDHLPVSRLRFGFFELDAADAAAIWALVNRHSG